MPTKKKDPKDLKKVGRPSDFKPQYCQMLIEHMKGGGSLRSFGSIVSKPETTLHNWTEQHPEFLAAKKIGEVHSFYFYENMGKMLVTGQLKLLVEEKPKMHRGKQAIGPDGKPLFDRKYIAAHGSTGAWAFMMKNMHGWRDQKNIAVSGDGEGGAIKMRRVDELSPDEKLKEIREMTKALQELGDNDIIDITPIPSK